MMYKLNTPREIVTEQAVGPNRTLPFSSSPKFKYGTETKESKTMNIRI